MNTNLKPLPTAVPIPLSTLADRLDAIKKDKAELDREAKIIEAEILTRYEDRVVTLLKSKDEPFGSVNVADGDITLGVTIPKKVDWDQDKLAAIYADITANGASPAEYMTVKYDVSESKYKAWPEVIRGQFEPARTVAPGKAKIEIKRKGE